MMIIKENTHATIHNQIKWLTFGILLICVLALCNIKYGAINYSLHDIVASLFSSDDKSIATITILKVRLPMVLMAIMAGSSLAISGLLLQRVTQNPLACPSLSGIEYGTACTVILSYMFIPNATRSTIIGIALIGGLLTYLLMQTIIKKMRASTTGITLIGVAFDTLYYSAIQAIMLAFPYQAQAILYDLNGSLQGITLHDIQLIWLPFILLISGAFLFSKHIDLLDLDEFQATTMGIAIKKYRLIMLGLSIFLATLMTSVIGPLLFFGLIIPHLVKPFAHRSFILLFCAIFGAVFLLIAELVTQMITPLTPPPVGLVMLLIAAPTLIFITRRYLAYAER